MRNVDLKREKENVIGGEMGYKFYMLGEECLKVFRLDYGYQMMGKFGISLGHIGWSGMSFGKKGEIIENSNGEVICRFNEDGIYEVKEGWKVFLEKRVL